MRDELQEVELLPGLEEVWEEGEGQALDHEVHLGIRDLHHSLGEEGWLNSEEIKETGVVLQVENEKG